MYEPRGFGVSRIEPLCSPASHKIQLMKASRGLTAGAISSVLKVKEPPKCATLGGKQGGQ